MSNINFMSSEVLGSTMDELLKIRKAQSFNEIKEIFLSSLHSEYVRQMREGRNDTAKKNINRYFEAGIKEAQQAYLDEALEILQYLRTLLLVNDSTQIAQGLQNAQAAISALQYGIPKFRFSYKDQKNITFLELKYIKNFNDILNAVMSKVKKKAGETQALQEKIIEYQISGAAQSQGGGFTKLLIPLALGVGGFMLLKG